MCKGVKRRDWGRQREIEGERKIKREEEELESRQRIGIKSNAV